MPRKKDVEATEDSKKEVEKDPNEKEDTTSENTEENKNGTEEPEKDKKTTQPVTEEATPHTEEKEQRKSFSNNNVAEVLEQGGVVYFQAKRKLTEAEHKNLSSKIRFEMEETGLKIVLVPCSCEPGKGEPDGKK